jgi:hypothetical protein
VDLGDNTRTPLGERGWEEKRRELEMQIGKYRVSDEVVRVSSDRLYWQQCEAAVTGQATRP